MDTLINGSVSRGAGLGGGMGVFLGGPIVDELKDCVGAADVPASARRVLEVLVPLVYRPAMKVRGSATSSVPFLNRILCWPTG